jgi:DNA-directed RNA polymerase specialized sigma24 family protein
MQDDGSITVWLAGFKQGDPDAVQKIWERYYGRLISLARSVLDTTPRGESDEDDVVQSAFKSFYFRTVQGRFPRLCDRDDMWKLLMTITVRKALQRRRRENRHGSHPVEAIMDELAAQEPDPHLAMVFSEEFNRLLTLLGGEELRQVALGKLEGYTNVELAEKLGRSLSFVERKLRIIRRIWSNEWAV